MLAVQDSAVGRFLDRLGASLPQPRAIIVASAHFLARAPTIGAALAPATVHDFGGFPRELYDLHYPARGAPVLAARVGHLLAEAGLAASVLPQHGIDHGVWVPLRRIYPQAEIPVVPLSVNPAGNAAQHYAVGRALAGLRAEGVLVVGSGGFVHNLGDLDWRDPQAPMPPWACAFADWMRRRLARDDIDALLDWEHQAPYARHAHPTVEHLMPLFVAMGAGGPAAATRTLHQSHEFGSLALDAFAFG
jgi:4,5-DOPA dioxygenase extradiol